MKPGYKPPNFLVIGAEKSGTTWLYNHLKRHPQIYLPLTKECHFFNKYNSNLKEIDHYTRLGWDWYQKFFDDIPDRAVAVGEITPMYICDPEAPARIAKDLPEIKLIYILRNPVTRAYSHYWMAFRKGYVKKSFDEIVKEQNSHIILRGKYASQLEKYYDLFPAKHIRGFVYEPFFQTPDEGLAEIHRFLRVSRRPLEQKDSQKKVSASPKPKSRLLGSAIGKTAKMMRRNTFTFDLLDRIKKSGVASFIKDWNTDSVPYPPMRNDMFNRLLEFYMEDIEVLENKYNLKLNHWKEYPDTSI